MRRMEARKRVEELTYQVEALTRENTQLRIQVADTRQQADQVAEDLLATQAELSSVKAELDDAKAEAVRKYAKIGKLLADNCRLIRVNEYLAEQAGMKPVRRKYNENGDYIPPKP